MGGTTSSQASMPSLQSHDCFLMLGQSFLNHPWQRLMKPLFPTQLQWRFPVPADRLLDIKTLSLTRQPAQCMTQLSGACTFTEPEVKRCIQSIKRAIKMK